MVEYEVNISQGSTIVQTHAQRQLNCSLRCVHRCYIYFSDFKKKFNYRKPTYRYL